MKIFVRVLVVALMAVSLQACHNQSTSSDQPSSVSQSANGGKLGY